MIEIIQKVSLPLLAMKKVFLAYLYYITNSDNNITISDIAFFLRIIVPIFHLLFLGASATTPYTFFLPSYGSIHVKLIHRYPSKVFLKLFPTGLFCFLTVVLYPRDLWINFFVNFKIFIGHQQCLVMHRRTGSDQSHGRSGNSLWNTFNFIHFFRLDRPSIPVDLIT